MRLPLAALALLALGACQQKTGFQVPDQDDTAPVDTGYVHTGDSDTADTDGDLDDDGFTPEEGDCDDNSIYVSPAREEDTEDALDNDCDGRVDEEWWGLDVAYDNDDGSAEIFTLDAIGRVQGSVGLDEDCAPLWMDHASWTDPDAGWIINNGYASVTAVSTDGLCTPLADFSKSTSCDVGGVYGVATGPDGTIYATTLDSLVSVGGDGTVTELATWDCDLADPAGHQLAAYSLAVDPLSGEVGLFGYFGGFATWSAANGLDIQSTEDLKAPTVLTYSGAHRDEGGWYTPGIDGVTGAYGIYQYDLAAEEWALEETWEDEDWVPFMLAIDGDSGDYYVTANAGWYYTVWRVVSGSGYAADLYTSDGTEPYRQYSGIVADYTYGG